MKHMKKVLVLTMAMLLLAVSTASAYHFRGYFSGNVGLLNLPGYSDYVYKVQTNRDWAIQVTRNPSVHTMIYEMVNSNNETRGAGLTTNQTTGVRELSSSGVAGYMYRLRVRKATSNPLASYSITANWDTDKNQ